MEAVLRLIPHQRLRTVDDSAGDLRPAVGGQAVQHHRVVGGGWAAGGNVIGNVTVNIIEDAYVNNLVYGGYGADITGDVTINIAGNAYIRSEVFGCNAGTVNGNTAITMTGASGFCSTSSRPA